MTGAAGFFLITIGFGSTLSGTAKLAAANGAATMAGAAAITAGAACETIVAVGAAETKAGAAADKATGAEADNEAEPTTCDVYDGKSYWAKAELAPHEALFKYEPDVKLDIVVVDIFLFFPLGLVLLNLLIQMLVKLMLSFLLFKIYLYSIFFAYFICWQKKSNKY